MMSKVVSREVAARGWLDIFLDAGVILLFHKYFCFTTMELNRAFIRDLVFVS